MFQSKQTNSKKLEEEEIDFNTLKVLKRQMASLESGEKAKTLLKETWFKKLPTDNEEINELIRKIEANDYVINKYKNEVKDGVEKLVHEYLKPASKTPVIEKEKKNVAVQTFKSYISDQFYLARMRKFELEEKEKLSSVDPNMTLMESENQEELEEIEKCSQDSDEIAQMFTSLARTKEAKTLKVVWSSSAAKRMELSTANDIQGKCLQMTETTKTELEGQDLSVEGK